MSVPANHIPPEKKKDTAMNRFIRVPYLLLLCSCALVSAAHGETIAPDAGGYAVVVSEQTYDNPEWKAVVDALVEKHQAKVITYEGHIGESLKPLRKFFPRYACFVAQPEEAGRKYVVAVHRLTRKLDSDPYTDVVWGIITGYGAEDALRIANLKEPLIIRKGAGGTPFNLKIFDEGVYYIEGSKNSYVEKKAGGSIEQKTGTGDDAQPLAEALCRLKPDFFVTSGHATERDWQIGYPTGNEKGMFVCKDGVMIAVSRDRKKKFPIHSPNPKVLMAWGNCLMGHVKDRQAMALAWMHSVGVNQLVGYTVNQWCGWGGNGTFKFFFGEPGRYTYNEAFFFNNQTIVYDLETRFPKTARLAFNHLDMQKDRKLLNKIANILINMDEGLRDKVAAANKQKKQCPEMKDNLGLLYDRDTLAFYGDPAWEVRLAPRELPFSQKLTSENDEYTFRIVANADCSPARPPAMLLPCRLKDIKVTKGGKFSPLITDNFIMLMNPGKFEKDKTYKVVFKAKKVDSRAAGNDLRKWADGTGRFQVQAKYLGREGDKVKLEKANGKVILVPIEKFCEADRRFLDELENKPVDDAADTDQPQASTLQYQSIALPLPPAAQAHPQVTESDREMMKKFPQLLKQRIRDKDPEAMGLIKGGKLKITLDKMRELVAKWEKKQTPDAAKKDDPADKP